jgi:hypothetical protein
LGVDCMVCSWITQVLVQVLLYGPKCLSFPVM